MQLTIQFTIFVCERCHKQSAPVQGTTDVSIPEGWSILGCARLDGTSRKDHYCPECYQGIKR